MSLVDVKVELGFNEGTFGDALFTLDSATDSILGTSRLAGVTFADVSSHVMALSVSRGRSRQLDSFNAGTATVRFNNRDRAFDPTNTASPYYPSIVPRCLVRITCKDLPVFYGYVNDWDIEYDVADNDVASVSCSDAFMIMSNQTLRQFTPSVEATGTRIDNTLSRAEVDFRGGRRIDAGNSTLGGFQVDANTNVLNYLRQIEKSEPGFLFVASDGDLVFVERGTPPPAEVLTFADDGSGIPYRSLSNQFGDELLFNYVVAKSPAGAEQVKSDEESINKYQISDLSYSDLLNSSTTEVADIANSFLSMFKEPKLRFTGFSVQMLGLTDGQQDSVLGLDLTDFVYVLKSYAVGTPTSKTELAYVSGIFHDVRPGSHTINFAVESATQALFLVLGDTLVGTLDNNLLDF